MEYAGDNNMNMKIDLSLDSMHTVIFFIAAAFCSMYADASEMREEGSIRTFFVTRSIGHERFMDYLESAQPEFVQVGNYGAMFHGYADDEGSTGWPMQLPVKGEREALAFQRELNKDISELGLKVIGHFRLVNVLGDWEERAGFIDYYENRWPDDLLGPKPHDDVLELLQRDSDGVPLMRERYPGRHYLHLCLSSPYARQMLKQMLSLAIDHGVDGVITTYNYHFGCVCEYCQEAFRGWLKGKKGPEMLYETLGIENPDEHVFDEIPARISGYPDPEDATELDWLAMRWGAEHFKRKFDRIFIEHGRSEKPGLIVATWNHLGNINRGEERAFLPLELWGRGEDYFWYSGGASFVGQNHNLEKGKAGDAWLAHLYIRELAGGKPFVMGKYDRTRMEVSMAEGYATGGMGMGRYMRFEHDKGFNVLTQYTNFIHRNRVLYENSKPFADLAFVLPRQSVQIGRPRALDAFREIGQNLVEKQYLIDVVADRNITKERLAAYPAVVLPKTLALSDKQKTAVEAYMADGGTVIIYYRAGTKDESGVRRSETEDIWQDQVLDAVETEDVVPEMIEVLNEVDVSAIQSPWTVRATAYRVPGHVILHLVNYDREEGAPDNNRTPPETERPAPVEDIEVDLRLPDGARAASVKIYAPERVEPEEIPFDGEEGVVSFTVPRVRVYGVIAVEMK